MTVQRMALAFVAAGLVVAPAQAVFADVTPTPAPTSGVVQDRTVRDPAITEASGLAMSPTHPGVLWTVNDSGHPPILLGLGTDGATVARVRLTGVPDVDWEAVAAWRDPSGHPMLAAADIGDNRSVRSSVEIDVVAEPARLGDSTRAPLRRLRLRYPDGPHDAEALLVDARAQRMYVATKGFDTSVYAVPTSVWPGTSPAVSSGTSVSGTLQLLGTAPVFYVTDGAVLPGGRLLLRTYGSLVLLEAPTEPVEPGTTPDLQELAIAGLPRQVQGEGLAVDLAKHEMYLGSEGVSQPVLRIPLPVDVAAAIGLPVPTASGSAASGTADSGTAASGTAGATASASGALPATSAASGAAAGTAPNASASFTTWAGGTAGVVGVGVLVNVWIRRARRDDV